jgi:hypothetical protein
MGKGTDPLQIQPYLSPIPLSQQSRRKTSAVAKGKGRGKRIVEIGLSRLCATKRGWGHGILP